MTHNCHFVFSEISLNHISPVLPPDILKYPADCDVEKHAECQQLTHLGKMFYYIHINVGQIYFSAPVSSVLIQFFSIWVSMLLLKASLIFLKLWPGYLLENFTQHSRISPNIPTVQMKYSQESFEISNTVFCDDFSYGFASLCKSLRSFLWPLLILSTRRRRVQTTYMLSLNACQIT